MFFPLVWFSSQHDAQVEGKKITVKREVSNTGNINARGKTCLLTSKVC
jgi:hypothetical protein